MEVAYALGKSKDLGKRFDWYPDSARTSRHNTSVLQCSKDSARTPIARTPPPFHRSEARRRPPVGRLPGRDGCPATAMHPSKNTKRTKQQFTVS